MSHLPVDTTREAEYRDRFWRIADRITVAQIAQRLRWRKDSVAAALASGRIDVSYDRISSRQYLVDRADYLAWERDHIALRDGMAA